MRRLALGSPPPGASPEQKIDWCITAIKQIERASYEIEATTASDSFDPSNVTETRAFDADTVNVAGLADVLGTLINDLKRRGQKRAGG